MQTTESVAFACPRCDRALDVSDDGYNCGGCKVDFPLVGGLPWLFAEPAAALSEWQSRFDYLMQALDAEARRALNAANRAGILPETRTRLEQRAAAGSDHVQRLRELLSPLGAAPEPRAAIETYLALRTRLPPDQGLMTYYPNIHRDWCWGDEENQATIDIVLEACKGHDTGKALVLGSGAGRLAYDFHQCGNGQSTVALDFNPLLSLLGQRITSGETIELYEFPLAPLDSGHAALLRRLRAAGTARPGLDFVIADVQRPPFAAKRFDTIITPWLIDILPGDFGELCGRINHLLADGGVWVNFGSLNFHQSDPAADLGPDECFEIVRQHGFDPPDWKNTEIPYLCSPASRHGRREKVLSWGARKNRHVSKAVRHAALPDWIVRGRDPIPAIEHFRVAAVSTRIHAQIMGLIDGRRSIADIASMMEEARLMRARDAETSIRGLLIKLFDESQIKRP